MRKETREIIALTEKWMEKITELAVNYSTSISQLEKIRAQLDSPIGKFTSKILPYIIIFILLLAFIFIASIFPWCGSYKYDKIEISKPCITTIPPKTK